MATAISNYETFKKIYNAIERRKNSWGYGEKHVDSPLLPVVEPPPSNQPPSRFEDLPVELIVRILKLLPGIEIARFQRVSKNARKIVAESVYLQYSIEQHLAGAIDGDSASSLTLPERLSAMREWREAWTSFKYTIVKTALDCESYAGSIAQGPVYAMPPVMYVGPNLSWGLTEGHSLVFGSLTSALREYDGREWTLPDLPTFHVFACDYDQDLLILVFKDADDANVTIRILTMDTGVVHPLASSPLLEVVGFFTTETRLGVEVELLGDFVCLRMYPAEGGKELGHLWVFHWKTGQICMDIYGDGLCPEGFAFLDPDRILVISPPHPVGNIYVFNCRIFPPGTITLEAANEYCELVLELPRVDDTSKCDSIEISCRPIRSAAPSRKYDALFLWANKLPVVVVSMYIARDDADDISVDILIPGSTIVSRLSQDTRDSGKRATAWEEWKAETRIIDTTRVDGTGSACGSRYITVSSPEDEDRRQYIIYDFDSPPAMLKDILSGQLYDKDLYDKYSNADAECHAPCRVIRTNVPVKLDEEAEIYEDGIIVRNLDDAGEMEIYTI